MVRVTLRPPSDWTLAGSMLGGSETKALSWNGISSEGEGTGWYSSLPVTCQTQCHTKTHYNTVYILLYYTYTIIYVHISKQTEQKY